MSNNKNKQDKQISVPANIKQGVYNSSINVNGIEINWDLSKGCCYFRDIPIAIMWIDSTLANLMSGMEAMVGSERFHLALQVEGRKSVESDWLIIEHYPEFSEGFAQLNLNSKVAGWGDWQLISYEPAQQRCVYRIYDNWEGLYQKALGVCWGSGMLAGKLAGINSKLFATNCWATQTHFIAKGDAYDEFVVVPSNRNLEAEIANQLSTDNATKADMAVALQKLQITEQVLRESENRFRILAAGTYEGIAILDQNAIFDLNEQLEILLGYDHLAILNKPFLDFVAEVDKERVKNYLFSDLSVLPAVG